MDSYRIGYYKEIGYSDEFKQYILEKEGYAGVIRYWKVFDAYSVERLLMEHHNCVIDMGGGSTYCVFPDDYLRIKEVFTNHTVILLMPTPNKLESLEFLNSLTRCKRKLADGIYTEE